MTIYNERVPRETRWTRKTWALQRVNFVRSAQGDPENSQRLLAHRGPNCADSEPRELTPLLLTSTPQAIYECFHTANHAGNEFAARVGLTHIMGRRDARLRWGVRT
jgi:hypothetical protein